MDVKKVRSDFLKDVDQSSRRDVMSEARGPIYHPDRVTKLDYVRVRHWADKLLFLGSTSGCIMGSKGKCKDSFVVTGDTFTRDININWVNKDRST